MPKHFSAKWYIVTKNNRFALSLQLIKKIYNDFYRRTGRRIRRNYFIQ